MAYDLTSTLLLIPCCKGKQGRAGVRLPERRAADMLSGDMARQLEEGRRLAFGRTHVDLGSPARPALATYTGYPYATPGLIELLVAHIRHGLHCLIISGGYGLLRPEESIHVYEAHLQQTRSIWRHRIPALLQDYVARNGIQRTFGVFSSAYATVVPDDLTGHDWRAVQQFDPDADVGAPMYAVPRKVGRVLVDLMSSGYQTGALDAGIASRANAGGVLGLRPDEKPPVPAPAFAQAHGTASAQNVRRHIIDGYVKPARQAGLSRIGPLRASTIHAELGLQNRVPLVCSVMDSCKFQDEAGVDLIERSGPRQGPAATFTYLIRP